MACGNVRLTGWINVDKFPTPATDFVIDVRRGLPFSKLSFIFAEHFIEHLSIDEVASFLRACRRALGPDGVLRLSTPNLDWVYRTHYHVNSWQNAAEASHDCFAINQAFHGWGHRFLFNASALTAILKLSGFAHVQLCSYGTSEHAELMGLERHERSPDSAGMPHVLVVEATGENIAADEQTTREIANYLTALHAR